MLFTVVYGIVGKLKREPGIVEFAEGEQAVLADMLMVLLLHGHLVATTGNAFGGMRPLRRPPTLPPITTIQRQRKTSALFLCIDFR